MGHPWAYNGKGAPTSRKLFLGGRYSSRVTRWDGREPTRRRSIVGEHMQTNKQANKQTSGTIHTRTCIDFDTIRTQRKACRTFSVHGRDASAIRKHAAVHAGSSIWPN
eukprot:1195812-Prorocentrum_minimum.AAC.2